MLVPVLICGGLGTRLWPVSRKSYPKQFLNLIDKQLSLMQITAQRLNDIRVERSGWIIVCAEEHRFIILEQLDKIKINVERIILEPFGRNTAPAITLASIEALKIAPHAKILVQPSDHFIPDAKYFIDLVELALKADQPIMTFGVTPSRPETGYGYIDVGNKIDNSEVFSVKKFIEKPKLNEAKKFINKGNHLWNSGIFLLDTQEYLKEIKLLNPTIYMICKTAMDNAVKDLNIFLRVDSEKFRDCPSISIDNAVLEISDKVSVIPFKSKWSDIGSWESIISNLQNDDDGNVVIGDGLVHKSTDVHIHSEERLVVALGVNNLSIIETPDVVLVTSKSTSQDVGQIIDLLRKSKRIEADKHLLMFRPWGSFRKIFWGKDFQIKKIVVKPGKSLSLQSHKYRSEHWIIIEGTAKVVNGSKTFTLTKNESTFIAMGDRHRLTNCGLIDLILIEVQTGSYLGEDDILRYKDDFGRVK